MSDIALILAAGASKRLGQPKQLLEIDGESLVARAVRVAREAGLEPVVVTGCRADDVAAAADVRTVFNADWADGMGTSVAAGVRAVATEATTITVMTCDQVRVTADDLRRLRETDGAIAAASYDGVLGVPARFLSACFDALMELSGDFGAQHLIRDGGFDVTSVVMNVARFDVDEPSDVDAL